LHGITLLLRFYKALFLYNGGSILIFFGVFGTDCYLINAVTSPILTSSSISDTLSLLDPLSLSFTSSSASLLSISSLSTSLSTCVAYWEASFAFFAVFCRALERAIASIATVKESSYCFCSIAKASALDFTSSTAWAAAI
jgi:hypothetical protein